MRKYVGEALHFALGLVITVFSGLVTLVGNPRVWPDLTSIPLIYAGDGLAYSFNVQRVLDSNFSFDTRTGWPWGSDMSGWPADPTMFLAVKIFGLTGLGWVGAINLILISAFALNYLSAYVVARLFKLNAPLALALGIAFALLPWVFWRMGGGHVSYTWYWPIPIFIYVAFAIAFSGRQSPPSGRWRLVLLLVTGTIFFFIGGTAVYFPIFAVITLTLGALFAAVRGNLRPAIMTAFTPLSGLVAGFVLGNLTFFLSRLDPTRDGSTITRYPQEAEAYALHIAPLFLPTLGHRIAPLEQVTSSYYSTFSVARSETIPQGVLVTLGLVTIGLTLVFALSRRVEDVRLRFLSYVGLFWLIFASLSGLNHLFNLFVNPSIRAWSRASIVIAFIALMCLFLVLQKLLKKVETRFSSGPVPHWQVRFIGPVLAGFLIILAIFDQTPQHRSQAYGTVKEAYSADRALVGSLEKQLPDGASVFQLPYMPFPENGPIGGVRDYEHFIGYLHSEKLNWSYGVFKGSAGDAVLRAVSQASLSDQIRWAEETGYGAVWINLRGYNHSSDEAGKTFLDEIDETFGREPDFIHSNGEIWIFLLNRMENLASVQDILDYSEQN